METVSFCRGNCLFLLWKQIWNNMVYNKLVIYRAKYQSFLNEKWRGKITRHHIYTLYNWLITKWLSVRVTRWWDKYYFPNEKKVFELSHVFTTNQLSLPSFTTNQLSLPFFFTTTQPSLPKEGFNLPPAPSLSREGSNRDYSSLFH